jgi:hypothetical protein
MTRAPIASPEGTGGQSELLPVRTHGTPSAGLQTGPLVWFALVAILPLVFTGMMRPSHAGTDWLAVLVHVTALSCWGYRLWRSGLRLLWASATVFGVACAFATNPLRRLDTAALGEAVFLYVLLSLFAAYDRQPGLQALASAALLLSAGVLTKPPIAISCLLLSVAFFFLHRRRERGGSLGFALLMFTPAALCIASASLLTLLTRGAMGAPVPAGSLLQAGLFSEVYSGPGPASLPEGLGIRWLVFPVAVVLYRFWIHRISACDIAFAFMLGAVAALSVIPHMPEPLHRMEIVYLGLGGAAALLAQTPPKRYFGCLLICASLLGPLFASR